MVIDSLIPWGVESSQLPKRTLSLLVLIRSQAYKTEDIACTKDAYIIKDTLGLLSWFLLKLSAVPISIPVLLVGFACQKIDNDVQAPTPRGAAARMSPPESAELPWWAWHHRDLEAGKVFHHGKCIASNPCRVNHPRTCPCAAPGRTYGRGIRRLSMRLWYTVFAILHIHLKRVYSLCMSFLHTHWCICVDVW